MWSGHNVRQAAMTLLDDFQQHLSHRNFCLMLESLGHAGCVVGEGQERLLREGKWKSDLTQEAASALISSHLGAFHLGSWTWVLLKKSSQPCCLYMSQKCASYIFNLILKHGGRAWQKAERYFGESVMASRYHRPFEWLISWLSSVVPAYTCVSWWVFEMNWWNNGEQTIVLHAFCHCYV